MKRTVAAGVKLHFDGRRYAEGDEVVDPPEHLIDLGAFEPVKAEPKKSTNP